MNTMSLYYRTLFDIHSNDVGLAGLSLMSNIEELIRDWVADSFPQHPDIRNAPEDSSSSRDWLDDCQRLRVSGRSLEGQGYFWLRWNADKNGDGDYRAYLGFRLATEGSSAQADIEVKAEDDSDVDFESELLDVFERLLARYQCSTLGSPLSTHAEWVETDEVKPFWDSLASPDRCLPTVVVSELRGGGMPLDADALQQGLLGLATVAVCSDEASWQLGWHSWRLMCYDGQVRVYAPGLSPYDDQSRHRLWDSDEVAGLGAVSILNLLRDECSHRIHYPQGRDALRAFSRVRMRIWRARAIGDDIETIFDELNAHISDKTAEAEREKARSWELENENNVLREKVSHLDKEIRRLSYLRSGEPSDQHIPIDEAMIPVLQVKTVDEAVAASESLPYVRVFERVPKDCRRMTREQAQRFYEVLLDLNRCGPERVKLQGVTEADFMREQGVGNFTGSESQATMNQYGDMRLFSDDDGCTVEMQPHISVGKKLRLHLLWSGEESRWLVGYYGPHLRIVSTM